MTYELMLYIQACWLDAACDAVLEERDFMFLDEAEYQMETIYADA